MEEQASGSPLLSELEAKGFPAQAVPAGSASKSDRLYARANRFESGQVLLPRKAPWLDDYVEELTTFPDSDFSDQVDSTSQTLAWDVSSGSFNNAIRALELLNGRTPIGNTSDKKIKLRVLEGGGTITFADGSGRPDIQVPEQGETLEVDEQIAGRLIQSNWKKYEIVPE